ncbi:hypothetical protein MJO28_017102 [Puccinia striiformis f. sp. tritici]|nr:hypothetical protein MJO28_017102 [Puccinia striiformis f. sp. tritici]
MFSYAVKAILICSAVQLAGALVLSPPSETPSQLLDAVLAKRFTWGAAASGSASASASVSAQAMVQGWSSAADSASQCQSVFEANASVDVAFAAVASFASRLNEVNAQYGQCACGGASATDAAVQFQAVIIKLLQSWQIILQLGQQQYGADWNARFKPVFQSSSSAFITIKNTCGSLHIDLAATLQQAQCDLQSFLNVGLDLKALFGFNFRLGGFIH